MVGLPRARDARSLCWCSSSSRAPRSTATGTGSTSAGRSACSPPSWPSSRWSCGAPTCWPARSGCSDSGGTCWCRCCPSAALILVLVLLGHDLGHRDHHPRSCRAAVGRGAPAAALRAGGGRRPCMVVALHGQHPVDPDVAHHRLAAPRPGRPAGQRAAGAARQVRPGLRRLVGRRPRRLQEKWGALPEAHTDFIFAIIGEELGLVGTLAVLALFGVLGYAGLRIALDATEPFVRSPPPASPPGSRCRRWSTSAR